MASNDRAQAADGSLGQYTVLAKHYDDLIDQEVYSRFARRIDRLLGGAGRRPLVLELGCGTGGLTTRLSGLEYEMIGVDSSFDMLALAQQKAQACAIPPVFLAQDMTELDLYGTVDAAVSCLDSLNYLTQKRELKQVFSKVNLFLNDGGLLIFDVKTPFEFARLKGLCSVYETERAFCTWRYDYERKSGLCAHMVDVFEPHKGAYRRWSEVHFQRAYALDTLTALLCDSGFEAIRVFDGYSTKKGHERAERWLFCAKRKKR